jgi:hypothetical protein
MTAMAVFLRNQMRIIAPFATLIVLVVFFSLTSRSVRIARQCGEHPDPDLGHRDHRRSASPS